MATARQMLLPFPDESAVAAFEFVEAPSNAAALAWLGRVPEWPDRRLAIWGEEGCGKTHLLRDWASRAGAAVQAGSALRGLPDDLPPGGLAIDDADSVTEQETLLHWLNTARDAAVPVLLTGRVPPSLYPVVLPDLVSRLRAITPVQIGLAEDELLRTLLAHLLAERQWRLDPDFQEWLLPQLPRTPALLREMIARLDRRMLATGGRITQRAVGEVLEGIVPHLLPSSAP